MKLTYLLLIVALFVSCQKKRNNETLPPTINQVINIENALKDNTKDFSSLIDSSWVIALKAPKDKLQGIISKVQIYNNLIYTLDEIQSKSLNMYDRQGTYIRSFGKIGRGPEELLNICDFCIYNDRIYLVDNILKNLQIFDINSGDYIKTVNLPFRPHEMNIYNENTYFFKLSEYNDESAKEYQDNSIVITDSLFNTRNFFLPHPRPEEKTTYYIYINNPIITRDNEIYYFSPMKDYIYQYMGDSLIPRIAIDFGLKYEIPDSKRYDDNNFTQYAKSHDYAYMVESPILLENYLAGIIRLNKTKSFILCDAQHEYTQEINLNNYNVLDPIFPIGKDKDNVLISTIDVIGIEQLKKKQLFINEINNNEDCSFLLFTKLK